MTRFLSFVVLVCPLGLAQTAPDSGKLPIRRVVLYKNGVGYFEHSGPVHDNEDVAVSFTPGQLNDVLKTLTVLDLNGGRISGVNYDSPASADRQRDELRLGIGDKVSVNQFLQAIRGARVEIKTGSTTLSGRLLSLDQKPAVVNGVSQQTDYVSVVGDNGEMRTAELTPNFSMRLLDKGLNDKVARYLDLASSSRDAEVRRMVVSTTGSGDRNLYLSYISEVPVWKATYRVVLSSKAKPLLQGWAIVDNTVGQDWDNVQLSLVAGAPQSFIQNLAQPLFTHRPVVPVQQALSIRPQTFEATLNAEPTSGPVIAGTVTDPAGAAVAGATVLAFQNGRMVGQTKTDASGTYSFASLPNGVIELRITSPGFKAAIMSGAYVSPGGTLRRDAVLQVGSVSESVTVTAQTPLLKTESGELSRNTNPLDSFPLMGIGEARARQQPAATTQALGDLFEYKLKEPVTIERNKSALVPILQSAIDAEKVSVWNEQSGSPRPQRALWLTNSAGVTLDGGSFTVLEEETFAGEGILDPIHQGEKRLVSYAVDLAVNASATQSNASQVTRILAAKGILTFQSEYIETKTYTFRNEDSQPRMIIVEHPVREGYKLRGDLKPAETTANWMRFRLAVPAKETKTLVVEESRQQQNTVEISALTRDQLIEYVKSGYVNKPAEASLRKLLEQKSAIETLENRKAQRAAEAATIARDQGRLRENIKTIGSDPEERTLLRRYTSQLDQQESRLEAIEKETRQLETEIDDAQAALDKAIEDLAFDEPL